MSCVISTMLRNIHRSIITASQRRNGVFLVVIKHAVTASSSAAPYPPRPSHGISQHAPRLFSSSSTSTSAVKIVKDETVDDITTTTTNSSSHDIMSTAEASPQTQQILLPTRRSGRTKRNPLEQPLYPQLRPQQRPLRGDGKLLSTEKTWLGETTSRAVMGDTARSTVTTADKPDMSVKDEDMAFSYAQEDEDEQRRRLDVAIVGLPNAGAFLFWQYSHFFVF
jgi:hypothetical protein